MDSVLLLFVLASFLAIAGIAFVVGQYLENRIDLQRRMPAGATAAEFELAESTERDRRAGERHLH